MNAELARLIATQVCLHASMTGLRMAAPLLALQQGQSAAWVGLLMALFALAQVFLALPAGHYVERHGLRRPVGLAVLAASAGAALPAVFPHILTLSAGALLTGGATGVVAIALQRHVGRVAESPTQLREMFSFLATGPAFSNFIGPVLAGLAIDHAGFRTAFGLLAALPLLGWLVMRPVPDRALQTRARDGKAGRPWTLLRDIAFRRLLIVNWLLSSCWDVHTFMVPLLGHEKSFSATTIGVILGGFAIASTLVRLVIPMLARHLREWLVVFYSMLAVTVLFGVYPLLDSPLAMGLCSALLGIALGCVQPMVMSTLHQITPHQRHGEALGLRLMAINGSSVLMPMMFGALGAVLGVAGVFWTVGALVGTGSRLAWLEHRR